MPENVYEWVELGVKNGWCSKPACSTHDGVPLNAAEEAEFDDGYDPCVHVVRLYHPEETP